MRLRPDEWTSGEIYWLIDMIGDPRGLNLALKQLMAGPFKETDVKVAVRGQDGAAKIWCKPGGSLASHNLTQIGAGVKGIGVVPGGGNFAASEK